MHAFAWVHVLLSDSYILRVHQDDSDGKESKRSHKKKDSKDKKKKGKKEHKKDKDPERARAKASFCTQP